MKRERVGADFRHEQPQQAGEMRHVTGDQHVPLLAAQPTENP